MFEGLLQPMHLLVIFGIALLVFGPRRLPELGKGLGQAISGFKNSLNDSQATASAPATRDEDASPSRQVPIS
jgi:sec-independent protein translocase protein TatA